jgi:hypothetical protein
MVVRHYKLAANFNQVDLDFTTEDLVNELTSEELDAMMRHEAVLEALYEAEVRYTNNTLDESLLPVPTEIARRILERDIESPLPGERELIKRLLLKEYDLIASIGGPAGSGQPQKANHASSNRGQSKSPKYSNGPTESQIRYAIGIGIQDPHKYTKAELSAEITRVEEGRR